MIINSFDKPKLTYETGIYVFLALLAIVFRFGFLGSNPLSDGEAASALQALNLPRGVGAIIGGNPGYVSLTTMLFTVFEGNEFWARFWSAIFGSGLVMVPFLFRKYLGRGGALMLAGLLVIDPAMISVSRTAANSIMGITCFLAGLGFLVNKKYILASLFWGLFFCAGKDIWPELLVFGVSLFAYQSYFKPDFNELRENWKKLVIPGILLLFAVSSQLMIHPNGISGIGTSFGDYIESWHAVQQIDLGHFLLEAILLQLPLILFSLVAIISGLRHRVKLTGFLATWWGLGFILVLINPSRNTLQLGWVTIPLLCLTAILLTKFFASLNFDNKWIGFGEIIFSVLMIGMAFFYLMNITNSPELDPVLYRNKFIAFFLPIILLLAITGLFTWGWNSPSAKNGLLAALSVTGIIILMSNGWKATGWTSPIEKQLWKDGYSVTGDRSLITQLSDLGRWTNGQSSVVEVEIAGLNSPSLNWALRNISDVTQTDQVSQNATTQVLITPVDAVLQTAASYRGQKIIWSETPDITAMNTWDWIKWSVYRKSPVITKDILLWVRNDLFK